MIIDRYIDLRLVKNNVGWELQIIKSQFDYLRRNKYETNNKVSMFLIENLADVVVLQDLSRCVLSVSKEQVANWILEEVI